jgi:hypothetical protein
MSTITTMAVGNPACSLYTEINNMTALTKGQFATLTQSGHDKLHDGLTHITEFDHGIEHWRQDPWFAR